MLSPDETYRGLMAVGVKEEEAAGFAGVRSGQPRMRFWGSTVTCSRCDGEGGVELFGSSYPCEGCEGRGKIVEVYSAPDAPVDTDQQLFQAVVLEQVNHLGRPLTFSERQGLRERVRASRGRRIEA